MSLSNPDASARSENAYPLRFYANPLKLMFLLIVMLLACACAAIILFLPVATSSVGVGTAYVLLALFGFGVIAYLILIALLVIMRRPLLEIDNRGWTYRNPFTFGERFLAWANIASISIRTLPHFRAPSERFIIARPRRTDALPHAAQKALIRRALASSIGPELAASCRYLYLWGSQARAEEFLHRIETGCAGDIHAHHVAVISVSAKPSDRLSRRAHVRR
jgi:hypothetical protein